MRRWNVKQWFRVEPAERPWVLLMSGASFFLTAGNVLLWILLQTLLIKRAGVEWFPAFYIISSLAILLGAWLSSRVFSRLRSNAQSLTFGAAAFAGSVAIALTQHLIDTQTPIAAVLAYLGAGLVVNSAFLVVANDKLTVLAGDVFNTEQLQRIQPMVTSVAVVSSAIAGVVLAGFSESVPSIALFALVSVFLLLGLPFLVKIQSLASSTSILPPPPASERAKTRLRDVFPDIRLRHFLFLLAAAAGLSMVFTRIFNYELAFVANARYITEAELNAFNGWYTAVFSAVLLVFVNTVQRFLLERYGLTRNLFVPPIVVAAGVGIMIAFPMFAVVVPVILMRDVIISLQQQAWAVMLEGISDVQRDRAWTWINGPVTTIGGLLGSVLLAIMAPAFGNAQVAVVVQILSLTALLFLIIRVALDVHIRRLYPSVLLSSVQSGDFKTRLRTVEVMSELRFVRDRQLGAVLDLIRRESEPSAIRLAALRTLASIKEPSSLRVISELLSHPNINIRRAAVAAVAAFPFEPEQLYESGFSRHALTQRLHDVFETERHQEVIDAILDALVALRDPDIIPFIIACLNHPSAAVQQSALHSLRNFEDPAIIDIVKPFLEHPSVAMRAQALAAIWRFAWERPRLDAMLDDMLKTAPQSEEYRRALYLIGRLHLGTRRAVLLKALSSEHAETRLAAAIALLKQGSESGAAEIEAVMQGGEREDAASVERLAAHPDVPAAQQQFVERLIHAHHLHYPGDLPVSEALRVRLCDIPRPCLEALVAFYQAPEARTDLLKIQRALVFNTSLPPVRSRAHLVGLAPITNRMYQVALLAHGYEVIESEALLPYTRGIVIGMESDRSLPPGAYVLSESPASENPRAVPISHNAPSELIARFEPTP